MEGIRERARRSACAFQREGKLLEAQRLEQRTLYDLEMLEPRWASATASRTTRAGSTGARPGETPYTLYDYFPEDLLVVLDESHISVPQIGGMYRGDRARKETLVEYGWRLPSALDNRPLRFDEWEERARQRIYVSATPAEYELREAAGAWWSSRSSGPTGLMDPKVEVRPASGQVDDLLGEIRARVGARASACWSRR